MPPTRELVVVATALAVGALHFVVGPDYRGPFSGYVRGYLIDLLAPFAMFLVLGLVGFPFVRRRSTRAVLVFAVGAFTETLQFWGVPLFGSTFDPLDYAAFAVSVLAAVWFESTVIARLPETPSA